MSTSTATAGPDNAERNVAIIALRAEGKSRAEISRALGVSFGVVRGVLERARVKKPTKAPLVIDPPELRGRVVALRRRGMGERKIARETGLFRYQVRRIVAEARVGPVAGYDRLPEFLEELAPLVESAEAAARGQLVHTAVVPIVELVANARAEQGQA